jgi:hypothetical protein
VILHTQSEKIIVLENLKELAINLEIHSFNGLKKRNNKLQEFL